MARVREGATAIAQLAAANQENFIKNSRQLLATLSEISFLVLATNRPFCETHFSNLRKLLPDYLNFGLIETNGMVFCSAEPTNRPVNLGDRPYFQRVIQTRKFATGDFQVSRLTGRPSLNFGYPVLNERGELQRVLYASLKLSLLSEAVARIRLPSGGTVTIFDRNGNILARHPEPENWVGKALSATPVVQRILSQKEAVFEMPGLDGVRRLYAVTAITDGETPSMFVSVGIPVSVSFAHANKALVRNLIVLGLVAVIVFAVARLYAQRFFLRPVNALVGAARQLAEGNLSVRTATIQGSAELLQLGNAFDDMAERLQKRQAEVEQAHKQISTLNEDLERRVAERTSQLEEANKELASFSYSVSHDLRSPLRGIDGFSQALEEDYGEKLDDTGRKHLARVRAATHRMGELIDDLLKLSQIARAEMHRQTVDLSSLAQAITGELQRREPQRQVYLEITDRLSAEGDPRLLRVALENLFGNAWKFTGKRSDAKIEFGRSQHNGQTVFYVRDNGAGFDMAYAAKLFGAFQRLHSQAEFEGTGIGLATVQRIVHRHGGRVWAEGEIDKGATIYFTL
jgi:signal transduction histidine kinase